MHLDKTKDSIEINDSTIETNQFDRHFLGFQHPKQHLVVFYRQHYVKQLNDNYLEVFSSDQHLKKHKNRLKKT